jgi:hypothetical protein
MEFISLNDICIEENNLMMNDEMEKEIVVIKKNFDYEKKKELVRKIEKIKKKEYLINIFKIIQCHSKDYNINNNGVFIFFHNLPDEVYEQIETYVNNIYKMHKKSSNIMNLYGSDLSDTQYINSDTIEIENEKELSTKEKQIMRRKKYENYLNQNQEN